MDINTKIININQDNQDNEDNQDIIENILNLDKLDKLEKENENENEKEKETSNLFLEINDNYENVNDELDLDFSEILLSDNLNLKSKPIKNYVIIDSESEATDNSSNYGSDSDSNTYFENEISPPINYKHIKKGTHITDNSSILIDKNNLIFDNKLLESYKMIKTELINDLEMCSVLISNQNYYKTILLKKMLNSYIKTFKSNKLLSFHPKVIKSIKEISNVLNLYNLIASLISDILFTKNINKENQICKYIQFILPFLDTYESIDYFLNQFLILINNNDTLFDEHEILEIFKTLITKNIININVFRIWYNNLDDDNLELHNKLNINHNTTKAVYVFLEHLVH